MVSDFKIEQQEVEKNWNLSQLILDLEKIKTYVLSTFEKNCLYALLSRYNLDTIRSKIGWKTTNALRTELSSGLYMYIKTLLGRDTIIWSKIADWLEPKYRKQPILFNDTKIFLIDEQYRSQSIISFFINKKSEKSDNLKDEYVKFESLAIHQLKNEDFIEAIKNCKEALDKDISYIGMLAKIARCYYGLGLYNDTWEICNFLLQDKSVNASEKLKLNTFNFLGSINQESALKEYNFSQVTNSIYNFTEAKKLAQFDVLPTWNLIHTFLLFRNNKSSSSYLQRAKIETHELLQMIKHTESNFKTYQKDIIMEAKETFIGLDKWWLNVLQKLEM